MFGNLAGSVGVCIIRIGIRDKNENSYVTGDRVSSLVLSIKFASAGRAALGLGSLVDEDILHPNLYVSTPTAPASMRRACTASTPRSATLTIGIISA